MESLSAAKTAATQAKWREEGEKKSAVSVHNIMPLANLNSDAYRLQVPALQ